MPEQLLTSVTTDKNTIMTRDTVRPPMLLVTLLGLRPTLGLTHSPTLLAPLFTGPFCVSLRLGGVNYRLMRLDTGVDAGLFHVVYLQPFHSWDCFPSKCTVPEVGEQTNAWALDEDEPLTHMDSQTDLPVGDML